jgi:DNA/RNA endonuclease G (NUC1)
MQLPVRATDAIHLTTLTVALVALGCSPAPFPDQGAPAVAAAMPEAAPAAVYRNHLEFGEPTRGGKRDGVVLAKRTFVHSHDCEKGGPNWVSWNLNHTHYGEARRSRVFMADRSLPPGCRMIVSSDYTGSSYTRGHMVRSQERTRSAADNAETFLLTNVLPQHQDLNGGPWHRFELYLQRLAQQRKRELYVIAGGYGSRGTLKDEGRVNIPERNFKIVVVLPFGGTLSDVMASDALEVIAVDMPNVAGIASRDWTSYVTTVAALEAATGYDFLDALPDSVERYWESRRYR